MWIESFTLDGAVRKGGLPPLFPYFVLQSGLRVQRTQQESNKETQEGYQKKGYPTIGSV
jgi:hypothetical protein